MSDMNADGNTGWRCWEARDHMSEVSRRHSRSLNPTEVPNVLLWWNPSFDRPGTTRKHAQPNVTSPESSGRNPQGPARVRTGCVNGNCGKDGESPSNRKSHGGGDRTPKHDRRSQSRQEKHKVKVESTACLLPVLMLISRPNGRPSKSNFASGTQGMSFAFPKKFFDDLGWVSLLDMRQLR